jgi:hypothetical protein
MQKLIHAIALVLITASSVHAQSGTPEDQRACNASVKKYCARSVQGGDMAILGCLQQNRPRISRACQGVLVKYGQ